MDEAKFWTIIAVACRSDASHVEDWDESLRVELEKLTPAEIIEWDQIFDRLSARAYTVNLWGAAYLINGGASDDGFYYFRCWLIGMGRQVYEAAVAAPDSLASADLPALSACGAEAEIYAAAHRAWMAVTGRPDTDPYPVRSEHVELFGEDWDFGDDEQVRLRLPQLAALYCE